MAVSKRTRYEVPPLPVGVDTGRPCPKYHDGTIKRLAPPARVRRAVALRFGASPGCESAPAACQYCGAEGFIYWPNLASGLPGSWVHFTDLHLDHIHPYSRGGSNTDPENFTLACARCNSSKWNRPLSEWSGVAH